MLISITTSYCPECAATHPARYEDRNGKVVYTVECPKHSKWAVVSSDSRLFSALRTQQPFPREVSQLGQAKEHSYVVPITDRCNMECPICYAESSPDGESNLSLEQLRRLAIKIKDDGGKRVSLTGGEPTLHPNLREMIRMVRQDVGIAPVLITNGLRIAEDYDYLLSLKEAGLRWVKLQFDTFDNHTYQAMRGRHNVSEKIRAVERIVSAGLRLGLIMTVCKLNLGELGRLLDYARSLVPALRLLQLQPVVLIGRFPANLESVTREDVIHALVQAGQEYNLRERDFMRFPRFGAGRLGAHPDCFAQVFLCVDGDRTYPLFRDSDTDLSPRRALHGGQGRSGFLCSGVLCREPLHGTDGVRTGQRKRNVFLIRVIAFMRPEARDEARIAKCSTFTVTEQGFAGLCERGCNRDTQPFSARSKLAGE